jgi:replication initiation and membrane attachment protein DnaB
MCVIYAIKKCEEVPAYSYFDTILKDWIKKEIVTFDLAVKEVSIREKAAAKKKGTKDPNWLKEYVKNFEEGVEYL